MRIITIAALIFGLGGNIALAEDSCLNPAALVKFDSEWERALLEVDVAWLGTHLADEFVWVHDHAALVDSKEALLAPARIARAKNSSTRSRIQSEVEARVAGSTGVVTGFTVVDRGTGAKRYNFMRTYAVVSGRCVLLGNHTMVVPEN